MSQPIRVLRIIARMNVGGPAWQVSALVRGLDGDRFESLLISGEVGKDEADFLDLRDPGLSLLKIPSLGRSVRIWDDLRALLLIRRAIRRFRPDIVHTHTAKAGVLGRLAAASCQVPVRVHTFHGHTLHGYFGRVVSGLSKLIERVLARGTTVLVAVGEQVRDDLVNARIGRPDQYIVIPPGVETPECVDQTLARSRLGLPTEVPVVLFVGRLTAIKRPDRLIEAMRLVLERHPNVVLAVAGEGGLLAETERLAAPLGSSVRFLGWQSDIGDLFAAADFAVLTSDSEGMPVTLIEAAMAGIPSVTTDAGSAREVVLDGVTGIVTALDSVAVATGLARLLDNDLCKQMGASARERAEAKFGTRRLLSDHEDLYGRLMADLATGDSQTSTG
ncbi:MAG: glycosyltransferase family 4 protein [Acidimicrobiales bacterium]|nr:glycosyltransferase family 4 protein [Acidimicrobiales bacterium]